MSNWSYDPSYRLTSPLGMRIHPVTGKPTFHRGIDIVVTPGNGPLYAFVAGEVTHAKMGVAHSGIPSEMGIVVAIKDDKGYLHLYAHLSAAVVKVGDKVARGQMIGRQGTTGVNSKGEPSSTGNHLHYEIRKVAKPSFGWTPTEAGVVEPTQYLVDYYASKIKEEDLPMTKEERAAFDKLTDAVDSLTSKVTTLTMQVKAAGEALPAPKWFVKEFGSADLCGNIHDPNLTAEGWRTLAISLRMQK